MFTWRKGEPPKDGREYLISYKVVGVTNPLYNVSGSFLSVVYWSDSFKYWMHSEGKLLETTQLDSQWNITHWSPVPMPEDD
jgi:hypothetical protein